MVDFDSQTDDVFSAMFDGILNNLDADEISYIDDVCCILARRLGSEHFSLLRQALKHVYVSGFMQGALNMSQFKITRADDHDE